MGNNYFMITIDTEGDDLWQYRPQKQELLLPETKNAQGLYRFQELCDKYQLYPTYLTDYEMACSPVFIKFGREVVRQKRAEIGMHMHAFSTPPFYELSDLRGRGLAFAGEYPSAVLLSKMEYMTKQLEDTFQTPIVSHRGGRWYLDNRIIKILDRLHYRVDCTVTPGVDWRSTKGQTGMSHGTDYSKYRSKIYKVKNTGLWEIPVTVRSRVHFAARGEDRFGLKSEKIWLRPDGNNLENMIWLVDRSVKASGNYIEFMIHSSELTVGTSPNFRRSEDIERLYGQMDSLFSYIRSRGYIGITCADYVSKIGEKA